MNDLSNPGSMLPAAQPDAIQRILAVESEMMKHEQVQLQTEHVLHARLYARTLRLAPRVAIVGVLIKIPTLLVVHGSAAVYDGERWHQIKDYQVIPASAGRKQIFLAEELTEITMIFASKARTVAEAEAEFTDETEKLLSRRQDGNDLVVITGVQ